MHKPLIFLFFLVFSSLLKAQPKDDCNFKISVLTCSPGDELYSTFGHSALRIVNQNTGTDLVYNWGTFNFNDPEFYTKFVKGKLDYFLSVERTAYFIEAYQYENRSVIEQQLNLSCNEKLKLYTVVMQNLEGASKFYKYDFLKDNCTSRIRDLLLKNTDKFIISDNIVDGKKTYRDQLYEYLDKGNKPWEKLGIDILLGVELDKPASDKTAMFLPDYLMKGIDSSAVNKQAFVLQKNMLFNSNKIPEKSFTLLPFVAILIFSIIVIAIGLINKPGAIFVSRLLDSLILYVCGILGLLILFMWFGTEHTVCKNNYNLIWALPTHFIAAFFIWKRPASIRKYFFFSSVLHFITILFWAWFPQHFNIALLPFVALLTIRTFVLSRPTAFLKK